MNVLQLIPAPFQLEVRWKQNGKTEAHAVVALALVESDTVSGEKEKRVVSLALTKTRGFVFVDQRDDSFICHYSEDVNLCT